ncbi:hypothetical protein [Mycoplasmopsis verecunda]|uniref:Uncharacterized protein n=1 Tax=Mycoplasmopsis verecunda TaxID=171291 RepID=A0A1T4M4I1_9BACT|nr:hypothetical protein [Mycoplasmopsis verecunda]WPB54728.1 hypothetical protein SAM46_01050 [Mycoplasmopsis verecunda]SJZ61654.1 hypothetical protein SAMN02745154_00619 [Mycoplasmopsis verecunda]
MDNKDITIIEVDLNDISPLKNQDNKSNNKAIEEKNNQINIKSNKLKNKTHKKYILSRAFFVFLNVLAIFISASIVILNLYAIRFNEFPDKTMIFFVLIAVLSVVTTLVVSVQIFLGITDKKIN